MGYAEMKASISHGQDMCETLKPNVFCQLTSHSPSVSSVGGLNEQLADGYYEKDPH